MADGPGQSVGLHFVADRPEPINNVPHHHHPKSVRDHVLVEPNQPPKDGYPSLVNFLNTGLPAAVDHKSSTGSGVGLSSAPNGDAIVTNEFQKRSSQSTSHYQNESVIPEPSTAWRRPTPLAIATHNVSPASQRINGVKLPSPTQHSHSQWKSPSTHPPPMSAPPFFHPQAAHHPGPYHASSYGHNPAHDEIANQMPSIDTGNVERPHAASAPLSVISTYPRERYSPPLAPPAALRPTLPSPGHLRLHSVANFVSEQSPSVTHNSHPFLSNDERQGYPYRRSSTSPSPAGPHQSGLYPPRRHSTHSEAYTLQQYRIPPPHTTTATNGTYSSYPAYPPPFPHPYPPPYPPSYRSYSHLDFPRDRSPQQVAYNRYHSMSPQYQAPPRSSPYMPPPNYAGVPAGAELAKGNMPVPSTGIQTYSCADHGAQRHSPNRTTQPPYRYPPDHPYHPPLWVESNNAEANAIGHVPPYRNIRPDFDRPPLHPERPQRRSLSDDTLMQPKMEPTKVERASEPPAIRAAARLPSADGDMDADSEGEGAEYSTVVPSSHQSGDAVQEGKRQSAGAANVGEGEESSSRVRKRKGSVGAGRRIRSTSASSKRKKLETTSSKERPTKEMHAAGHDEKETMKRAEVDMVMNGSQEKKVAPVPGGSVDSIEDASKSQIPETKINGSSMWAEALTDGGVKEESNGTENYGTDEQPIESNANHNSSSTSLPFDSGQPNVQYTRHGVGSLEVQMEFDMTSSEIDIMGVSPSPMHDAEEKFETSSIVSESAKIESPESATVSELVGIGSPAPGDYEPQPPSAPSSNSFCFCNGAVESTFYIGCDQCDQWFHGICVDVAESESRRLDKWYCSSCVEKSGGTLSAQYKRTCANPGCRRRANTDTGFCSGDCGRNWAFMRVQEVLPALKVDEDALDRARSKIEDYIDGWAALDTEIVNRLSFLRDFRGKVKQMLKVLDKRRDRVCEVASAVRETCGFDERILTWAEQTDMTIRRLLDLWIRAEEGAVEMMVEDTEMDVEFADVSEGVSTSPCDNVRGKCQMHERWTDVKIWEIDLESVQLVDFLNQLHNEEETVMERLKNFRESLPERGREVMLL